MPYLKQPFKDEIKEYGFNELLSYFITLKHGDALGALNYIIFKLVVSRIITNNVSYAELASIIGTIECSKQEIYRRLIVPYEDKKIKENGDVL